MGNFHYKGIYRQAAGTLKVIRYKNGYTFTATHYMNGYTFKAIKYMNVVADLCHFVFSLFRGDITLGRHNEIDEKTKWHKSATMNG